MKNSKGHITVLLKEAVDALHIENQAQYIDATLGAGGDSVEIVKRGGYVYGIEDDPEMIEIARENLNEACPVPTESERYKLIHDNFRNIASIAHKYDIHPEGILFDLGISSIHYTDIKRGFTFNEDSQPLDMRLNPEVQKIKASDLLNVLRQDQLVQLFEDAMPVGEARFLAKKVVKQRELKKFETVGDLGGIVPAKINKTKTHPATKAFMALRMAVNNELDNLKIALPDAYEILKPGGVLEVITFHSGEERLVKKLLGNESERIKPSAEEIKLNPRSRSATMWVFVKNGK